jgi:hypothetical protein
VLFRSTSRNPNRIYISRRMAEKTKFFAVDHQRTVVSTAKFAGSYDKGAVVGVTKHPIKKYKYHW